MRTVAMAFVLALVVAAAGTALADKRLKSDLVLVGTVTAIETNDDPVLSWTVTLAVEKVLLGAFSDATFTFAVHSPVRAGLEVNRSYTIPARRSGGGYRVDEGEVRKRNTPRDRRRTCVDSPS